MYESDILQSGYPLNRILKGVAAMPVLQIKMVHGKTLEQKRVTVKELSEFNGISTKKLVGLTTLMSFSTKTGAIICSTTPAATGTNTILTMSRSSAAASMGIIAPAREEKI